MFSAEKCLFRIFFDENFLERHFRQATLIQDASRAPSSDVATLRRKGDSVQSPPGAEIPSLTRLA